MTVIYILCVSLSLSCPGTFCMFFLFVLFHWCQILVGSHTVNQMKYSFPPLISFLIFPIPLMFFLEIFNSSLNVPHKYIIFFPIFILGLLSLAFIDKYGKPSPKCTVFELEQSKFGSYLFCTYILCIFIHHTPWIIVCILIIVCIWMSLMQYIKRCIVTLLEL